MADLAELMVRIKADTTGLDNGLKAANDNVKTSAAAMQAATEQLRGAFEALVPAISAAAFVEFTKRAVEAEVELVHIAEKTGTSIEMLSTLDSVIRQNGGSLEDFANGIKFMNRNISEAAVNAGGPAAKAFKQLGLNVNDLLKLSTDERFFKITDAIAQFGNGADRTNLRLQILGRGAESLANLMDQGSAAIKAAADHAASLGQAITKEQAENIKEFNDNMQMLIVSCERLAQYTFNGLIDLIKEIKDFNPNGSFNLTNFLRFIPVIGQAVTYAQAKGVQVQSADAARKAFNVPASIPNEQIEDYINWMQKSKAAGAITDFQLTPDRNTKHLTPDNSEALKKQQEINKSIDDYIEKEKNANIVVGETKDQQAGLAAYYQLVNDLMAKGLTEQQAEIRIGPERKQQIEDLANAHAQLAKQQQEAQRAAEEMQRSISDGLTNIAFNFKSAGQAAGDFFKTIAQNIFKAKISDPLSKSIVDMLGGSSLFGGAGSAGGSLLGNLFGGRSNAMSDSEFNGMMDDFSFDGFADGGRPPLNQPSWVGENGPEIWWPDQAGTIIPRKDFASPASSGTINFTQVIQVSPGVAELIDAKIREAAPAIASSAQAGIFQAIQNGGSAAKLVGNRA